MKRLQTTVVMALALAAGTGLAAAAEAGERERRGGHVAERVTRHLGVGHLERGRHDVRHERYRKRDHGYGHHRYRAGPRHGHKRFLGKHRYRPYKGYAPQRKYRHRYRQRHHGHRSYRYGITFELDGLRYFLGGSDHRW